MEESAEFQRLQASMDLLALSHQAPLYMPLDGIQDQFTHLQISWSMIGLNAMLRGHG